MAEYVLQWPSTQCNDGWVSQSVGPGTCSHHGGVAYYGSSGGQSTNLKIIPSGGIGWLVIVGICVLLFKKGS